MGMRGRGGWCRPPPRDEQPAAVDGGRSRGASEGHDGRRSDSIGRGAFPVRAVSSSRCPRHDVGRAAAGAIPCAHIALQTTSAAGRSAKRPASSWRPRGAEHAYAAPPAEQRVGGWAFEGSASDHSAQEDAEVFSIDPRTPLLGDDTPESALVGLLREASRRQRCVLALPMVDTWWCGASAAFRAVVETCVLRPPAALGGAARVRRAVHRRRQRTAPAWCS